MVYYVFVEQVLYVLVGCIGQGGVGFGVFLVGLGSVDVFVVCIGIGFVGDGLGGVQCVVCLFFFG